MVARTLRMVVVAALLICSLGGMTRCGSPVAPDREAYTAQPVNEARPRVEAPDPEQGNSGVTTDQQARVDALVILRRFLSGLSQEHMRDVLKVSCAMKDSMDTTNTDDAFEKAVKGLGLLGGPAALASKVVELAIELNRDEASPNADQQAAAEYICQRAE